MSTETQLQEINDKLKIFSTDTTSNSTEIVTLIESLRKIQCTPADLKNCGLHISINTLRKDTNTPIAEAAKNLINHWRSAPIPSPTQTTITTTPSTTSITSSDDNNTEKDQNVLVQIPPPIPITNTTASSSAQNDSNSNSLNNNDSATKRQLPTAYILGATGSKSRDSIQKLFYGVFDLPHLDNGIRCELAVTIEESLFKHYLMENQDYKDRVRLLLANLKDPKNTDFRESIIDGEILPNALPTVTQAEMASKRVQASLHQAADYQLQSRKTDLGGGQGVDMFPCPKCKGRNTSFFQKQTRSADEPMTIFCTCLLCRSKWRIY